MSTSGAPRALLAFFALVAATPVAAAPGNGIRLGGSQGRLHPSLELETRYDSNVLFASQGTMADLVLHVRPGFELGVPGELASVELAAFVEWAQYLGIDDAGSKDLSKVYGGATLGVDVNPRGVLGLEIDDEFRRSPSTSAFVLGTAVVANFNELRLRSPWRPGGGALVVALEGSWTLETYEPFFDDPPVTAVLEDLGYNQVSGGVEARWRFLPRTSAVLEGAWFSRLPMDTAVAKEVSGVEVAAGLTGLVTEHLTATVKAGWVDALGSVDEGFGTWTADVEAEWSVNESISVRAGYRHGWGLDPGLLDDGSGRPVPALFTRSVFHGGGKLVLAGRYGLRAEAWWERRGYDLVGAAPTADLLRVEPSIEAAVARWLSVSAGFAYTSRESTSTTAWSPEFAYSKNEAWLRLFFRY